MPNAIPNTTDENAPDANAAFEYFSDAPIKDPNEDKFHRRPFAERVARIIAGRSDPSSLVVGLNAPWGDGKTSVLNFIESALSSDPKIVCVRFNPWLFSDEVTMLKNFFGDLARAVDRSLETRSERAGEILRKVAPLAELVPQGSTVGAVGELLAGPTLEKLRDRLEKTLLEEGKRVVVIMDDIDRLDKSEIQTLFRLVKLSADFQYTAYILAFDVDIVAAALQERYPNADSTAGRAFLEKIIQVPLALPRIPERVLRDFCFDGVNAALRSAQMDVVEEEARRFSLAFQGGLLPCLRTPRLAKRYANLLSFSLPLLQGEVNIVDLMLLEGVRSFYPPLYEFIVSQPELFLSGMPNVGLGSSKQQSNEEREKFRAKIEAPLVNFSPDEVAAAILVVRELFPVVDQAYGGFSHSDSSPRKRDSTQRISSNRYFPRYFAYTVPQEQIKDAALRALASIIETSDSTSVVQEMERLTSSPDANERHEKVDDVLSGLEREASYLSDTAASTLIDAIALRGELFITDGPRPVLFGIPSRVAYLMINLLDREKDDTKRVTHTLQVLDRIEPISLAIEIYRRLRRDNGGESENSDDQGKPLPRRFTLEETKDFNAVLCERIRSLADQAPSLLEQFPKDAHLLLAIWRLLGGREETNAYLTERLQADPQFATALLNIYPALFYHGIGVGPAGREEFNAEAYDGLKADVDASEVLSALKHVYGEEIVSADYPRQGANHDFLLDELTARRFAALHRHEVEEQTVNE